MNWALHQVTHWFVSLSPHSIKNEPLSPRLFFVTVSLAVVGYGWVAERIVWGVAKFFIIHLTENSRLMGVVPSSSSPPSKIPFRTTTLFYTTITPPPFVTPWA